MPMFDLEFLMRMLIVVMFVGLLSYGSYFRRTKNSAFAASFMLFGVGVFVVIYFLHGVDMSMGFAFGLFAVFTMLRYRTESISIREMTYLFLVIAIALITAVTKTSLLELALINSILLGVALVVDSKFFNQKYCEQIIQYEKIENIKPQNRQALYADLKHRTGLNIIDVTVNNIDFLRDTASLRVLYKPIDFESTLNDNSIGTLQESANRNDALVQ